MNAAPWWRRRACPPGWVLGQAASQGTSDTLAVHVQECPRCAAELRSLEQLGQRAQALKAAEMPVPSRQRILSALRVEAAGPRHRPTLTRRTPRWLMAAAAGVVLVGAGTLVLALGYHGRPFDDPGPARRPLSRAAIVSPGSAVAHLTDGDQWVAASPGKPVLAAPPPDGGGVTTSPVVAARPRRRLNLAAGPRGAEGNRGTASLASTPPTTAPAPERQAAFEHGWQLLRSGDLMGAARAFAALEQGAPGDAIVEDALFWRGVALGRAGEKLQARTVLGAFVARFPGSPRAPEACVLLGWMLVDAGDRPGARALFERAARDRSEKVRASARSGLQQLEALDDRAEPAPAPPPSR